MEEFRQIVEIEEQIMRENRIKEKAISREAHLGTLIHMRGLSIPFFCQATKPLLCYSLWAPSSLSTAATRREGR